MYLPRLYVLVLLALMVASVHAQDEKSPLEDVAHWLHLIDNELNAETVAQITDSTYDLVVIDFIPSLTDRTDYPLEEVIAEWHNAPHPKLVIAYINTGQAESYRTYWQADWRVGEPEWILSEDPEGWDENYPVAYWYDEWRDIWLAEDGYLAQVVAAGFDGVALDWVQGYSDETVSAFAEQEGVDPVQEMIWWVSDISETLHALNPSMLVIVQNAAELVSDADYVDAIDVIVQEQIWFDGGADNNPPGDCPLPRTDADVESAAYIESLSPDCRTQYETYPNGTLHSSSEAYLADLLVAQEKGLSVFTIDYALSADNIAWIYAESRAYGFVPFVSHRGLDTYLPPVP